MKMVGLVDVFRSSMFRTSTIAIPKRIKRDNLSILKALASITKPDYHAPQYKYIDDPFLIPNSGIDKKVYSLSYISGKDAARFVIDKYPNLFQHNTAHPVINDFMPKTGPTLPSKAVDGLKERIALKSPLEAYESYKMMFDEGIEVPREVVDDLLDLLCFTNYEPLPRLMDTTEAYYQTEIDREIPEDQHLSWKENGPAETLFKEIENPSPRNIFSLICGMVKFSAHGLAFEEYLKGVEQNVKFDISTYNAILSSVPHVKGDPKECWELVLEILAAMNTNKVAPNVTTFNKVLSVISHFGEYFESNQKVMSAVLGEMKKCGIESSLATWWHVLQISYPSTRIRSNILYHIMEKLKNDGTIIIQEPADFEFFHYAMEKCERNLRSPELAYFINNFIINNGYEYMLGNSSQTNKYYTCFLSLLSNYDALGNFMDEYNKLIPHNYTPTYKIFDCMLKAIEADNGYHYLLKVWSDMVSTHFSKRIDLLEKLVRIMANADAETKIQDMFVIVVNDIIKQYKTSKPSTSVTKQVELTGNLTSHMMTIYLKSSLVDDCWDLLQIFKENEKSLISLPDESPLQNMCEIYIQRQDFEKTHDLLNMMTGCGYVCANEMIGKALNEMELDELQRGRLTNLMQGKHPLHHET